MRTQEDLERFERTIMPHLSASYNLAHWLTRSDHDAEDVVQEAYLRALSAFDGYRGGDARAWMLTIVRNTCYTWLRRHRSAETLASDDADDPTAEIADDPSSQPEAQVISAADKRQLRQALDELPADFREVIVLRELEGFSYKEIGGIIDAPLGTVMSRLARARTRLQQALVRRMQGSV